MGTPSHPAGLEAQPLVSSEEYRQYIANEAAKTDGSFGISATYDQYNTLRITWSGAGDSYCTGGSRNISLHDQWGNDIDAWGTCLVDLGWLVGYSGGSGYWATVYCDDGYAGEAYSDTNYFEGWVTDLWGNVKVCGGYTAADGSYKNACTVAKPITVDW